MFIHPQVPHVRDRVDSDSICSVLACSVSWFLRAYYARAHASIYIYIYTYIYVHILLLLSTTTTTATAATATTATIATTIQHEIAIECKYSKCLYCYAQLMS